MTDLHPDKLAELVARALCQVTRADPDGLGVDGKPRWRGWCQFAEAAIEASGIEALQARLDAQEKALRKIADDPYQYGLRVQNMKRIARKALNGERM